jgi:hypothetical protein
LAGVLIDLVKGQTTRSKLGFDEVDGFRLHPGPEDRYPIKEFFRIGLAGISPDFLGIEVHGYACLG